jgi:hypothetical protein
MAIQILDKDIYTWAKAGRGRGREEKGESHEMPTARQQYNSLLWVLDFETET